MLITSCWNVSAVVTFFCTVQTTFFFSQCLREVIALWKLCRAWSWKLSWTKFSCCYSTGLQPDPWRVWLGTAVGSISWTSSPSLLMCTHCQWGCWEGHSFTASSWRVTVLFVSDSAVRTRLVSYKDVNNCLGICKVQLGALRGDGKAQLLERVCKGKKILQIFRQLLTSL